MKLKKTKKREADLPDTSVSNDKADAEKTKTKGDTAGKKNEKSVKVEKKDAVSKEKKPCSNVSVTQVTTRTRKAAETKETDGHSGSNSEKSSKTKKSKRKLEPETRSPQDPPNEEQPAPKKRKKVESKSKTGQEAPKGDGKAEERKHQHASAKRSAKKKTLRNRASKKGSKAAQKEPAREAPAQPEAPAAQAAQAELPPPVEPAPVAPPPPGECPVPAEPAPQKSPPRRDSRKEKADTQKEMARKEQVLIEVGLVPVKDSQLLKAATRDPSPPPPLLPAGESQAEESGDQKLLCEAGGNAGGPAGEEAAQEAGACPAGPVASSDTGASVSPPGQDPDAPDGQLLPREPQTDTAPCEMEVLADQGTAESPPGADPAAQEPASPLLVPPQAEEQEAASKAAPASPPVTTAGTESQEIDEDEGIHSHDGSDLSDNMSEGSDDSGLHGARPGPQEGSRKNTEETSAGKVAEGDFVCI